MRRGRARRRPRRPGPQVTRRAVAAPGQRRGRRDGADVGGVVERRVERATRHEEVGGLAYLVVDRGRRARAGRGRRRGPAPGRPTVGLAAWPHGPAPRSAAVNRRMRDRGHRGATVGVDLARVDQPLGRRQHRREPEVGLDEAVVVLAPDVQDRGAGRVVDVEVAHTGREREVEELGQLGPDLAGVGVDRVPPDEDEVERAGVGQRGGERAGRREGVGAGERGVGDQHPVHLDAALGRPRDRLAQRVLGGWRAEREDGAGPAVLGGERARPARQRAGSRRSSRGRCRRDGAGRRGPSSISSKAGICLTRAAMRMVGAGYLRVQVPPHKGSCSIRWPPSNGG